ncbi:MAG: hypothetical protein WC445_00690 [Patescibacteria group bacterium]
MPEVDKETMKELDDCIKEANTCRTECFNTILGYKFFIEGIFIGILGNILANYIFNVFDTGSLFYYLFIYTVTFFFSIFLFKHFKKEKLFSKMYWEFERKQNDLGNLKKRIVVEDNKE